MANTKPVPDDDGWSEISEDFPTRAQFDRIGDEFIGRLTDTEYPESNGKSFIVWIFTECLVNGKPVEGRYSVGETARLKPALKGVRRGAMVRIRYVGDIPTNQDSPMKDLRVAVK